MIDKFFDKPAIITVENVYKDFKLPHEKINSVKTLFVNPFRRKRIEVQHALKGISFDVKQGEFFGIVGRNGSGKSTLLKIIAEIYQPTSGRVQVNGKLVPFIELGVGFNPELTGRENVFLNGALIGFSKKEMLRMYDEIVDFAELREFMDQKLINYSSGMQVRLAFSVAIQAKADILLIDEVLAVGDADFQRKCYQMFRDFKSMGKTVLFVSHSMPLIEKFCDRVIVLDGGRIAFDGQPEEATIKYLSLFSNKIYISEKKTENKQLLAKNKKKYAEKRSEEPVAFKKVVLANGSNILKAGEEIQFRLALSSKKIYTNLRIGFGLFDTESSVRVIGMNTQSDEFSVNIKKGLNNISLLIEQGQIFTGNYYYIFSVFEGPRTEPKYLCVYDSRSQNNIIAFLKDDRHSPSILRPPHKWSQDK